MRTFVALLRGINVGGRNKLPMADLRQLCRGLGWHQVRSYIQSGNLVFGAVTPREELEARLEEAIVQRFGLRIPVIVRSGAQWSRYLEANPFPEESHHQPNLVMLALSKSVPDSASRDALTARAAASERIEMAGDALWIHFPAGSGRSKLSPALLDRLVGSPVTTRNWRTVLKLAELVESG